MYHIADLLIRIKNSYMAQKEEVVVAYSNMQKDVCEVLKKYGYIADFKVFKEKNHKYINITVDPENSNFSDLKIISTPGRRVYTSILDLKKNKRGLGIYILSTPKGVLSHVDALKQKAGGELICKVW